MKLTCAFEKTAMDTDGLPPLVEPVDCVILGSCFLQKVLVIVGPCCLIPYWLVRLNFGIGFSPAAPDGSEAKSTHGTLYPSLRVLLSVLRARS